MAADVAEELKTQDVEPDARPPSKGRSRKKLLIAAIVLVVVVVQAIVTWLLLPHAPAAAAGHKPEEKEHAPDAVHEPEGEAHEGDVAEVALGDFSFSNGKAVPGSIIHVDFKLAAVTSAKQASSLEGQIKAHTARVRQTVNKIVRSCTLEELDDPGLGTIKRQIREEINRLLKKSYVNEVVITDVRIIEQ